MKLAAPLLMSLALVACARTAEPDPTPANDSGAYNKIDPVPMPSAGGNAVAAAPGEWREMDVQGRPGIAFGGPGAGAVAAAIYCDERRGLIIERRGLVTTGEIDMMSLAAGNQRQDLAVAPVQEEGRQALRAAVPFNAELITVFQRSPIGLTMDVGEGESLSLPPTPLLPQLVNRCRTNG